MLYEQYLASGYLRAIVVMVAAIIVLRLIVSLGQKIVLKFASKTKTDYDDILVQKTSIPFTIIASLIGFRLGIEQLELSGDIESLVGKIVFSLGFILVAYILYAFLEITISKGMHRIAVRTKSTFDNTISTLINGTLKLVFFILGFLYILSIWGVQIGPLLAGLGIAGLAVALALQPTLSNIFSGVSMVLDKSIKVGDLIQLDNITRGKVERIGLRSTKIKNPDNEIIILPNTKLAESMIQNIALPEPKIRVSIPFSVGYGSDIEKVKKIVIKEILSIKHLDKEHEAVVRFIEMGASSLNFLVHFHIASYEDRADSIDSANTKIYNSLRKNNIEIPFPQMDVHLKK